MTAITNTLEAQRQSASLLSETQSLTIPTAVNQILVVFWGAQMSGNTPLDATPQFAGENMSLIATERGSHDGWYFIGPPSGANNLTFSWTHTDSFRNSCIHAFCFDNVKGPRSGSTGSTENSGALKESITCEIDDMLIYSAAQGSDMGSSPIFADYLIYSSDTSNLGMRSMYGIATSSPDDCGWGYAGPSPAWDEHYLALEPQLTTGGIPIFY